MVADGHNLHHSPCAVGRDCGDAKTEQVDSKAAYRVNARYFILLPLAFRVKIIL